MATVQFEPLKTSIHPLFWSELTRLKLNVLKLEASELPLSGEYAYGRGGISSPLVLDQTSYDTTKQKNGTLKNFNTIEEFKSADKMALLREMGTSIVAKCEAGNAPTLDDLNPFTMISFADLKKYTYLYWVAFPSFAVKSAYGWVSEVVEGVKGIAGVAGGSGLVGIVSDSGIPSETSVDVLASVVSTHGIAYSTDGATFTPGLPPSQAADSLRSLIIAFKDPTCHATAFAWPLRNVFFYLNVFCHVTSLVVVDVRESGTQLRTSKVTLGSGPLDKSVFTALLGWERNDSGKLLPRLADLSAIMDPAKLMDEATRLNLQLMKWRLVPDLDLDVVKRQRVLLLGAGTLGCYVARALVAWGVTHVTFVDSGKVSLSNPARQPLFSYEDALNGGKPKAAAAAANLKLINPNLTTRGVSLSIPMPGHPISTEEERRRILDDVTSLEELFEEHDVIYLLMDSRESRWLPTLLGARLGKLVITIALGFDTYVVMRHGVREQEQRLGCYYCNDVVVPGDTLSNRSLDQMCTVTRPGLAPIASASGVELMVSVLQSQLGPATPSVVTEEVDESQDEHNGLGRICPHQLRGHLGTFSTLKLTGSAYNLCVACSDAILEKYSHDFVLSIVNDSSELEKVTGLDQMYLETEKALEAMAIDSDEEDF